MCQSLYVYKHILLHLPKFIRYHFTQKESEARRAEQFAYHHIANKGRAGI